MVSSFKLQTTTINCYSTSKHSRMSSFHHSIIKRCRKLPHTNLYNIHPSLGLRHASNTSSTPPRLQHRRRATAQPPSTREPSNLAVRQQGHVLNEIQSSFHLRQQHSSRWTLSKLTTTSNISLQPQRPNRASEPKSILRFAPLE